MQTESNIKKLRDRVTELTEQMSKTLDKMTDEEKISLFGYSCAVADTLLWVLGEQDENAEQFLKNCSVESEIKTILER